MTIEDNLYKKSIAILTDLIAFKTVSGQDNSELINYCEKLLNDLDIETFKVFDGDKITFCPGKNFGKVIDTTGAGDCFNGALASALSFGKDLKQSVEFSCAAAGLSVLKRGTAQSSPTKVELKRALKTI